MASETVGHVCFDDYGRPFVILKDEESQDRLTGLDALKSHILAARSVADKLRTSLGPKGMDKLLVSPDGDVVITNDGATILSLIDAENEVAKLLVDLARTQDQEVGDGTTGVVVLAGALLERALELINKGIHPIRIADGYEVAAQLAARHLQEVAFHVDVEREETWLLRAVMTALCSKIASKCQKHLAELVVEAVKTTSGIKPQTIVNINSIILRGKSGGQIEDTSLVRGVIIGKDFAHPQMNKILQDVKVAVFTGHALQLPVVNTKHQLNVQDAQGFKDIAGYIDKWCGDVLKIIVDAGVQFVVYSGKIEDSLIHSLLQQGISAVEVVNEVDLIAVSVGASIVSKVEELSSEKLGVADSVRSIDLGTVKEKYIAVEQFGKTNITTIFVRGGNEVIVEEIKRSLQDAICVIRNLVKDGMVLYGGGAAEISCSLALQKESLQYPGVEQLVIQAFSEALDVIPLTLAENAGMFPLQTLTELKARIEGPGPGTPGVDCMLTGNCDMDTQGVVEGLQAKIHQLVAATQLVKMVLKIDDVRKPNDAIRK